MVGHLVDICWNWPRNIPDCVVMEKLGTKDTMILLAWYTILLFLHVLVGMHLVNTLSLHGIVNAYSLRLVDHSFRAFNSFMIGSWKMLLIVGMCC